MTITAGASDNAVYDDVISNNGSYGVDISGTGTSGNHGRRKLDRHEQHGHRRAAELQRCDHSRAGRAATSSVSRSGTGGIGHPGPSDRVARPPRSLRPQVAAATQIARRPRGTDVPAVVEAVVPHPTAQGCVGDVISGNDWEGVHIVGTGPPTTRVGRSGTTSA